jgi:DNA-binding MarR family transcriptional regulator
MMANSLLSKSQILDAGRSLLWIWLPVLIMRAFAEGLSFAIRASNGDAPLLNRRLGGAILTCVASMVVIAVLALRLVPAALTPGIAILLASLPLAFYAQICYASLFVETFAGIAVGLVCEIAGRRGRQFMWSAERLPRSSTSSPGFTCCSRRKPAVADPFARFDAVFFEKSRLATVALLYKDEYSAFTSLRESLGATDGAIFSHLERLIEGGYVSKRKEVAGMKAQTVYRLTDKGREEFDAYLKAVEEFLVSSAGRDTKEE